MKTPPNTVVTISIPDDAPGDVMVQLIAVRIEGHPVQPVKAGTIRMTAGCSYQFQVCPGVSLSVSHVDGQARRAA